MCLFLLSAHRRPLPPASWLAPPPRSPRTSPYSGQHEQRQPCAHTPLHRLRAGFGLWSHTTPPPPPAPAPPAQTALAARQDSRGPLAKGQWPMHLVVAGAAEGSLDRG